MIDLCNFVFCQNLSHSFLACDISFLKNSIIVLWYILMPQGNNVFFPMLLLQGLDKLDTNLTKSTSHQYSLRHIQNNFIINNKQQVYKFKMSSIFVQIGQCGCQIGHKLNKKLSNSYYATRIFPPNKVHAIMIDTEPKVLKPFIDNPPKWLDPTNVKYFQYGRGNNWSYGYMHELPQGKIVKQFVQGHKQFSHLTKKQKQQRMPDTKVQQPEPQNYRNKSKSPLAKNKYQSIQKGIKGDHSPEKSPKPTPKKNWNSVTKYSMQEPPVDVQLYPSLTQFQEKVLINKYLKQNKQICEYTLQKVRRQLDSTDCPHAINILCSLGGGTGSGLGTKIIEKIYQQFNMDIFAHVVLPNKSGQTPLQLYNCTLSLSSIQQHSTAIFTYENDNMINTFLQNNNSQNPSPFKGTDLDFINEQISQFQARFFRINQLDNFNQFYGNIVNQCVISKEMKYVTLFGTANTYLGNANTGVEPFDAAFQNLCQNLRIYNEQVYQIDGIQTRRQKCLSNFMVVMAQSTQYSNKQVIQQHHRKKLRTIINPIAYNSQLNIQQVTIPKKTTQAPNMNMSKISSMTTANTQTNSAQCQISFLMNHSNIVRYLQYLSVTGRKKYDAKAYLWHYKYADLETAFNNIETVIDQYLYATQ